ncbi:Catalase [Salmonella enterica subsp. enterica serovar Johannesburg str. S5-703]|nr:Catalase [Salmonella enterica subsp. enterica serovar Johannesburg str. S5-703]
MRIADDQNSLRAGSRGPTLLEDFILREKITHFDHERIPERIVHARGSAAHGYFQPYKDLSDITKAAFLCDPQSTKAAFLCDPVRSTENYPGLCSLFDSTGRRRVC